MENKSNGLIINEMENNDLEDGEIESDNDDKTEEETIATKPSNKLTEIIDKKSIIKDVIDDKNDKRIPTNAAPVQQNHLSTYDISDGDLFSSSLTKKHKKKKSQIQDIQLIGTDDDWMSNVENAIATALKKKDGTEPFQPNLQKPTKDKTTTTATTTATDTVTNHTTSNTSSTSNKIKKRKSRDHDKDMRKRLKTTQDDQLYSISQPHQQNDTFIEDYIDEYEMMCVRGGSPPPPQLRLQQQHRHHDDEFGNSDIQISDDDNESYSSYDSYEGRRRNHHQRRRRGNSKDKQRLNDEVGTSRNKKSNIMESKRRGRKNDDSDDDRENRGGIASSTHNSGSGGGGGITSNAFRKLELCKFYLMGCCAKREKCLYMHSDFPCKYYYLGMKPHDTDQCKFSHGAPLTDQLRNILLKHLETAPKEILGDFPRLSRDIAITMIQQQHQKLLKQYGTGLDTTKASILNSPTSDFNNVISPPSLSPITTGIPDNNKTTEITNNENKKSSNKKSSDRKRKTRWRDSSPFSSASNAAGSLSKTDNEENDKLLDQTDDSQPSKYNLRLSNLTGIVTTAQLERLAEIGVEYVDQINQLTVAQLNKLGLSISQIHEIQLNAVNLQPLKKSKHHKEFKSIKTNMVETYPNSSAPILPFTNNLPLNVNEKQININPIINSTKNDVQTGDFGTADVQDQDMRIRTDLGISTNRCHDVDMRIIQQVQSGNDKDHSAFDQSTSILNEKQNQHIHPSVINYTDNQSIELHPPKLDYSQYLKDSNLTNSDLIRTTATNDDLPIDMVENNTGNQISTNNTVGDSQNNDNEKKLSDNYLGNCFPMPAVYNPCSLSSTIFPVTITNKIDLSASVTKYLNNTTNTNADSGDGGCDDNDDEYQESCLVKKTADEILDDNEKQYKKSLNSTSLSFQSRDPRKVLTSIEEIVSINDSTKSICRPTKSEKPEKFENHIRQNSDIIYSTENDIDISDQSQSFYYQTSPRSVGPITSVTSIGTTATNTTTTATTTATAATTTTTVVASGTSTDKRNQISLKVSSAGRASIYELDDTTNNLNEHDDFYKKSGNLAKSMTNLYQENDNRRDKDMRLIFLSNDHSTGDDIDLRLPFTPNMANYIPATEIDGSISSHPPIHYMVKEIDIPRPNYAEIRRTAQMSSLMSPGGIEEILDPRLRQIFRIIDQQQIVDDSPMQLQRNTEAQISNLDLDKSSSQFISSTQQQQSRQSNKFVQRVVDPRCKNKDIANNKIESSALPQKQQKLKSLCAPVSSLSSGLDMQTILRESDWYASLSSKYKIMVNQQLALISTELKKFHQDQNLDKIFDLSFVTQNPLSHQVLTNLGVYINANGQFINLANSEILNFMNNPCDFRGIQKFPNNECDLLSETSTIGSNSGVSVPLVNIRFGNSIKYGTTGNINSGIGNNIRPGLLGIAPGIPCNSMYDNIDNNMGNNCDSGGNLDIMFSNNCGGDSGSVGGGGGGDAMDSNLMYFHAQNRQIGLNQNVDRLRYDEGLSTEIGGNQNEVGLRGRQNHLYKSASGRGTFIRNSSSGGSNNNRNTNRRNNYDGRDRNSRKNI